MSKLDGEVLENISGSQAKEYLAHIVSVLDGLDSDDFFGTEGWRHFFNFDDEYEEGFEDGLEDE